MKQLQKWFDLLAGVRAEEEARLAMARRIFSSSGPDTNLLAVPACWRRPLRVTARIG